VNATAGTPLALGLDAGGSATRWALADAQGQVRAEGVGPGFWVLGLAQAETQQAVRTVFTAIQAAAQPLGPVQALWAGATGYASAQGPHEQALHTLFTQAFPAAHAHQRVMGDMPLACQVHWPAGEGHVLLAGTGSMAAHADAQGVLHRVGGRGALLGDEGSGQWLALQALALLWRREDEAPGSGAASALGQAVFGALGGADWARTREAVYLAPRGQVGRLGLAVAAAAQAGDATALALLQQAGAELARQAQALVGRVGLKPFALLGRAWALHPAIEHSCRGALPAQWVLERPSTPVHERAAQRAAAHLAR
jgi:glucosamine kinase